MNMTVDGSGNASITATSSYECMTLIRFDEYGVVLAVKHSSTLLPSTVLSQGICQGLLRPGVAFVWRLSSCLI